MSPLRPLAALIFATVELYFLAKPYNVSPLATVWLLLGVTLGFGLATGLGAGFDAGLEAVEELEGRDVVVEGAGFDGAVNAYSSTGGES